MLLILSKSFAAEISTVTFTKLIDGATPLFDTTETLDSFIDPSISNGLVTFVGQNISGFNQTDIYTIDSDGTNLKKIAGLSTMVPGNSTTFSNISSPRASNDEVVFIGSYSDSDSGEFRSGVYKAKPASSIITIANSGTTLPNSSNNFSNGFESPTQLINNKFAFIGSGIGTNRGIFVADENNNISTLLAPGPIQQLNNAEFFRIRGLSGSGDKVAFYGAYQDGGQFSNEGIFIASENGLELVANLDSMIPGTSGTLSDINSVSYSGNNIVFQGEDADRNQGLYRRLADGSLEVVANKDSIFPGFEAESVFFGYGYSVNENGEIVFQMSATTVDGETIDGLFFEKDGDISKILYTSDSLDGIILDQFFGINFNSNNEGFEGNQLIFETTSAITNERALYLAEITVVPIPGAFLLFGTAILGLVGITKRNSVK